MHDCHPVATRRSKEQHKSRMPKSCRTNSAVKSTVNMNSVILPEHVCCLACMELESACPASSCCCLLLYPGPQQIMAIVPGTQYSDYVW
jgi:hypothetical protein